MTRQGRREFLHSLSGTALGVGGVATSVGAVGSERVDSKLSQQTETVTRFQQTAKLVAGEGNEFDLFGSSVALSDDGTTAVIGAYGDTVRNHGGDGSAYVFERSDDTWEQQQRLSADDGGTADGFGISIALSGNATTAVVGTIPRDSNGRTDASVYIFERSADSWQQQQKLTADDEDENSWLGPAVSVSDDGTTAIIAAYTDTDPDDDRGVGSAYVFERSGNSWDRVETLTVDDADQASDLGVSVAVSGDGMTAVIGSPSNDPTGQRTSAVYIFERSGNAWSQQQQLVPDDSAEKSAFGREVAVSRDGKTAIICGPQERTEVEGSGSAYVFEQSGGSWHQQERLLPAGGDGAFAQAAAVSGDGTTVFVGSRAADPNGRLSGAAYMFERSGEGWQQTLTPDDGGAEDRFGEAVAISRNGQTALCGAFWDNDPHGERSGSAYVFETSEVTLTPTPTITDTGDDIGSGFGLGTAVAGLGAGVYLLTRRFVDSNAKRD
jgi:hypothetical protein